MWIRCAIFFLCNGEMACDWNLNVVNKNEINLKEFEKNLLKKYFIFTTILTAFMDKFIVNSYFSFALPYANVCVINA